MKTHSTLAAFNGMMTSLILTAMIPASACIAADTWTPITPAAPWRPRDGHQCLSFDNRIWVIGGADESGMLPACLNDVWSSCDGTNWTQVTASAPWMNRMLHQSVVFDDKMWVMGGVVFGFAFNDVWSSADGTNWTEETAGALWSKRAAHACVTFQDKMWLLGGLTDLGVANDVWSSTNGHDWNLVTPAAAWSPRWDHQAVVFNDKIWVIGGMSATTNLGDVWFSDNGATWHQMACAQPLWSPRKLHASAVYNSNMWVLGGSDTDVRNDVWSTSNGANWNEVVSVAPWSVRGRHQSVEFCNKLWILGGFTGGASTNDVWLYGPAAPVTKCVVQKRSFQVVAEVVPRTEIEPGILGSSHIASLTLGTGWNFLSTSFMWTVKPKPSKPRNAIAKIESNGEKLKFLYNFKHERLTIKGAASRKSGIDYRTVIAGANQSMTARMLIDGYYGVHTFTLDKRGKYKP